MALLKMNVCKKYTDGPDRITEILKNRNIGLIDKKIVLLELSLRKLKTLVR